MVEEVPEADPADIDSEIGPVELSTPQPAIKKAAAKELATLVSNSVFKIHLLQFKKTARPPDYEGSPEGAARVTRRRLHWDQTRKPPQAHHALSEGR